MSVAIGTSRDTSAETITEKSMRLSAMSRELGDLLRNTLGRLTTQDAKAHYGEQQPGVGARPEPSHLRLAGGGLGPPVCARSRAGAPAAHRMMPPGDAAFLVRR